MACTPSAKFTIIPKAEIRDPQVKDLYHGELVIPPRVSSPYSRKNPNVHLLQMTPFSASDFFFYVKNKLGSISFPHQA